MPAIIYGISFEHDILKQLGLRKVNCSMENICRSSFCPVGMLSAKQKAFFYNWSTENLTSEKMCLTWLVDVSRFSDLSRPFRTYTIP